MRLLSTTLEPAQRRPGPKPRRHQPSVNAPTGQSTTLNEGRGRNPGDTDVLQGLPRYPVFQRSTKAGAETPATRASRAGGEWRPIALNEGRGRNPGDTSSRSGCLRQTFSTLNEGRGRNPGDTRIKDRRKRSPSSTLNEGRGRNPGDTYPGDSVRHAQLARSTKAGAETPATRDGGPHWGGRRSEPLNEGRGRNPGDTPSEGG